MLLASHLITLLSGYPADTPVLLVDDHETGAVSPVAGVHRGRYPQTASGRAAVVLRSVRCVMIRGEGDGEAEEGETPAAVSSPPIPAPSAAPAPVLSAPLAVEASISADPAPSSLSLPAETADPTSTAGGAPTPTLHPLPVVRPDATTVSRSLSGRWIVTHSRLQAARRCRREHHLAYEVGIRPIVATEAQRFGSLVHAGLEGWYLARKEADQRGGPPAVLAEREEILTHAVEALEAAARPRRSRTTGQEVPGSAASPYDLARARALLVGYDCRWGEEDAERWRILAVEASFGGVAIVDPDTGGYSRYELAGKLDVVLQERGGRDESDGAVWVMDHKVAGSDLSPGSSYWQRLRLDPQISAYVLGCEALGYDRPAGWVHDVLAKPGERPYRATPPDKIKRKKDGTLYANQRERDETPAEYEARVAEAIAAAPEGTYLRGSVVRLDKDLAEFRRDVWATVEEIAEADARGRHPRNPDACERYGSLCAYWSVCAGEASIDDATRFRRIVIPQGTEAEVGQEEASSPASEPAPVLEPAPAA